jgi:hypothetical protein
MQRFRLADGPRAAASATLAAIGTASRHTPPAARRPAAAQAAPADLDEATFARF